VMAFTLSGDGGQYSSTTFLPVDTSSCSTSPASLGQCGYYPSTAYGMLSSKTAKGLSAINIADLGQAPADGFTEYDFYGIGTQSGIAFFRPRWGDYSWSIYLSTGVGSPHYYFATEYIQSAACTDSQFVSDPSCGMTRDPFANWGSSINYK